MRTHRSSFRRGGTVPSFITVRKWAIIVPRCEGRSATVRNMLGTLPRSCRYVSKIGRTSGAACCGVRGVMRGSLIGWFLLRRVPEAQRLCVRPAPPDLEQLGRGVVAETPKHRVHAQPR